MHTPLQHIASLMLALTSVVPTMAQTFVKVSSTADIRENVDYLLVCEEENLVYAGFNADKKDLDVQSVTITDGTITDMGYRHIRLERTGKGWFIKDATDKKYIGAADKTTMKYQSSTSSSTNSFVWLIDTDKLYTYTEERYLASNGSSTRQAFKIYVASGHAPVTLFYNATQTAGIENIAQGPVTSTPQTVYDLKGRAVGTTEHLSDLTKGVYIINKHKIVL